jgi:hypothetical protein
VTLEAARPAGVDGGVESPGGGDGAVAHALVETVSWAGEDVLPAASRAATANPYEVPQARPLWPVLVVVGEATFVPLR